ncbi:MAG: DNA cytosine methyltransferase, partial [Bacteroidetes bacterium]|nr:DNA cytosine methyltransferase [Bacteroidota bacterium]
VLPRMAGLPKPYYIQPWQFGHPEKKKTGLFLHGLPPLIETDNVFDEMDALPVNQQQRIFHLPPSKDRWKIRSTTFPGIAKAMAEQWSKSL